MINKNKIKIVLFDIDNTLSYGEKAKIFYSQYSRRLESTLAKELNISLQDGKKIADGYREKYNGHGEYSFILSGVDIDVWYDAILSLNPDEYLSPLYYSNKLIKNLKKLGFIVGAVTDGPRIQALRILETIEVDENNFDFIIAWEKGGQMPKGGSKQIYEKVCDKYSVNPDEVVMIGDSLETDILPAIEAGLDVIYISDLDNKLYKTIKNIEELYKSLS